MKKIYLIIIFLLINCSLCFSAFKKDDVGTTTAQFLKLGAGARAAGIGDAYAGVSDDSTAIYWNPAGLTQIEKMSVSLMHVIWFGDIFYDWLSYVYPVSDTGAVGIGAQYLSYGDLKATDETGTEISNLRPYDLAVTISYASNISDILAGINVKYISSQIKERADAFAIDVGGMYKFTKRRRHIGSIGIAVQNVGTKMKFVSESESLPMNIKLGGLYRIAGSNWIYVLDVNFPIDNSINVGTGTEYTYKIDDDMSVSGRVGYNTKTKDIEGLKGLTAGFGIGYFNYNIDYAFVPFGNLGNTHRMSLGIKF